MSAVAVKSGMVGMWGRLEIWLWLFVELAALPAFAIWGDVHSPDRTALAGGVVELRENALFIISGIALCLAMLALSSAIIWRRRRRGQRFALMELLILGVGVVMGTFALRAAKTSVMSFAPTGVTISAPAWLGGEMRSKLVYSQIDWLGKREHISWKQDKRQKGNIINWMTGTEPAWRPVKAEECLVKMKGGEEAQLDLRWKVNGACDEVLSGARSAGVTVKPVERIIQPKPTD